MKRSFALALVIIALVAAACSEAEPAATSTTVAVTETTPDGSFVGADGVSSSIADTSRLVVLNGDLTETVYALGAGDRVVGIDHTTTYPEEATQLPDVGLGRDLNAEAVIGLQPTLVIGDGQVEPQSAIDQIRNAGIPVIILPTEVTLEGVPRKIARMGEILDLESEADALSERVQSEIDEALALAAGAETLPRAAYIYVRGPETLLLFGNGMATHFLIEAAAGIDAAGEANVVFAENLSAERLVTAAPEVLITPEEGFNIIGGLEAFLALPGVADTPAGQSESVLVYDEALLLGMGPRTGEALMALVQGLHPDLSP